MEFGGGCVCVVTIYKKKISSQCWLLLRFNLQLHLGSDQAWSSIEAWTLSKNLDQFLVKHKLWFLIESESHLWRIFLPIVVGQLIFQLKISHFVGSPLHGCISCSLEELNSRSRHQSYVASRGHDFPSLGFLWQFLVVVDAAIKFADSIVIYVTRVINLEVLKSFNMSLISLFHPTIKEGPLLFCHVENSQTTSLPTLLLLPLESPQWVRDTLKWFCNV